MKKLICFALLLLLIVPLVSCDEKGGEDSSAAQSTSGSSEPKEVNLLDLVTKICNDNSLTKGAIYSSRSTEPGKFLSDDLILSYYGNLFDAPDFTKISEYCVYIDDTDTNNRIELGIFLVKDTNDNSMVKDFITRRKDGILENAINYPSIDTEPFTNMILETKGNYTYYIAVKENRNNIDKTIKDSIG